MSQTQECGVLEIQYQKYLFQITIINEKEVGLQVVDTKALLVFQIERHNFTNSISPSTLIAILNKKNEESLQMLIENFQNTEKKLCLKLILKVQYNFLPLMQETIVLNQKNDMDKFGMLQIQQKLINYKINSLNLDIFNNDHIRSFGEKYVSLVKNGNYYDYQNQLTTLEIPKRGRYEINLSFYHLSQSGYIYLNLISQHSNENLLKIPEQLFYDANSEQQNRPFIIRSIQDLNAGTILNLSSSNCDCYPWTVKNLILSATSI
ncbi:hypothetical protein ABPG72_018233 [Tetrahymena utriculariae]